MSRLFLIAACATLVACGGSSTDETFLGTPVVTDRALQDAGANDESNRASSGGDAAAPPPTVSTDAGTNRCQRLVAEVERLRPDAMSCSLKSLAPQCNTLADDVCCKVVVTKDTQASKKFAAAVKAFKDAKCTIDCKAIECAEEPSNACEPMSGAQGTCQSG